MARTFRLPWLDTALVLLGLMVCLGAVRVHEASLGHGSFLTGYVLLTVVILLGLFHWRKQLAFVPIGRASLWLRVHVALGFFAMGIFALHVGVSLPNGWFESTLFTVFALTIVSGFFGLYISREYPLRLSKLREEYIYERIPALRAAVRRKAHAIVLQLVEETAADTVADFYVSELVYFFVHPRRPGYFLRPSSTLRNELQNKLAALGRYCAPHEDIACQQLRRLIDRRDDLDYHRVLQGRLKWWLFAHIGLTYALIILSLAHYLFVDAFQGSLG